MTYKSWIFLLCLCLSMYIYFNDFNKYLILMLMNVSFYFYIIRYIWCFTSNWGYYQNKNTLNINHGMVICDIWKIMLFFLMESNKLHKTVYNIVEFMTSFHQLKINRKNLKTLKNYKKIYISAGRINWYQMVSSSFQSWKCLKN